VDQTLEIRKSASANADFLTLPYTLYANEPAWRPPLRMERKSQVSGQKNPAMAVIEPCFFIAYRDGVPVGRIAGFINRAHLRHYSDETVFFGYFDCIDDKSVEDALLSAVMDWARQKGYKRLIGPAMWSVNEECGLLVDGFEHPPAVMMPYGRPHQVAAVERHGFEKQVDMLAYRADISNGSPDSPFMRRLLKLAERDEGITWRSMNAKAFKSEVALAMDIFNDAWSDNWGFIPFPPAQIDHMAAEMRPIMYPKGFWVAFIDEEPAAFIWMIPDVNEAVRDFGGSLLPLNWMKLLWRLKRGYVKKSRIPLMGVRKKYQNTKRGLAAVNKICSLAFDAGRDQGFTQCELSWILEDNEGVKTICDIAGADHYKTYRMYGANIS
jgi:GNAT superfamily N-acetyltransferase